MTETYEYLHYEKSYMWVYRVEFVDPHVSSTKLVGKQRRQKKSFLKNSYNFILYMDSI